MQKLVPDKGIISNSSVINIGEITLELMDHQFSIHEAEANGTLELAFT